MTRAPSTSSVEWLTIAGDPEVWRSLGLTVTDDGVVPLIGTSLRIVSPADDESTGVVSWALSDISPDGLESIDGPTATDGLESIDGLPTEAVAAAEPMFADHALGALSLDHVVVLTPDLERTSRAIAEATGCELKRVREIGAMRQGFHRIGPGGLIVELVERPEVPSGAASFWGIVLIVEDIDAACGRLGPDRISPPKDAVQPGRRIATVRASVDLGLPVALMSR